MISERAQLRREAKRNFDVFSKTVEHSLRGLLDQDEEMKDFDKWYTFGVARGGRWGGNNENIVDVFFGKRPVDVFTTMTTRGPSSRLLAASGAQISYAINLRGIVIVELFPSSAETEVLSGRSYVIDRLNHVSDLYGKLGRHFKILKICMQATAVDGDFSLLNRVRFFLISSCSANKVEGDFVERPAVWLLKQLVYWFLFVSLSGVAIAIYSSLQTSGSAPSH